MHHSSRSKHKWLLTRIAKNVVIWLTSQVPNFPYAEMIADIFFDSSKATVSIHDLQFGWDNDNMSTTVYVI